MRRQLLRQNIHDTDEQNKECQITDIYQVSFQLSNDDAMEEDKRTNQRQIADEQVRIVVFRRTLDESEYRFHPSVIRIIFIQFLDGISVRVIERTLGGRHESIDNTEYNNSGYVQI